MNLGYVPESVKEAFRRRRNLARGALLWVEAVAAIATVAVLVVSLANHFASSDGTLPGEGKRVVAFRQVTNRICTEHRGNLNRALREARSRVDRLGFIARALGWDLNDLEGLTPPPTKFNAFLAEVATRRHARTEVLALQQAIEIGDRGDEANAIATLEALEEESQELSRENGVTRCKEALPPMQDLVRG